MAPEDAVAAATEPLNVLNAFYRATYTVSGTNDYELSDYSGATNWVLLMKWSELTQSASTVGTVFNLMWTDVIANFLLGTKSMLPTTGAASVDRPATRIYETVGYDWRYAGLILSFAAVYVVLAVVSVLFYIFRICDFATLISSLKRSAAGRSMTTELRRNGLLSGVTNQCYLRWATRGVLRSL